MIPKKIHYCWFGRGEKSKLALDCINSWKMYCPDYELIEWNEDNFNVNSNKYTKEAFDEKKWAFITDYVRLYVLYNFGGIYMDTDVEIIKPIDCFLDNEAFSGFEDTNSIPTGIMSSKKNNQWIKLLLDYYNNKSFYTSDGKLDLQTNVITITELTKEQYNILLDNSYQKFDCFTIYPKEFFCPKNYITGKIEITDNTYTIHHFSGSWMNDKEKTIKLYHQKLNVFLPESIVSILVGFIITIKYDGFKGIVRKFKNKVNRK